jgi:hypothetical protein
LTQYYYPEIGVPQLRLMAMVRSLVALGHEVEIVTALPNYSKGKIFSNYHGYYLRFGSLGGEAKKRMEAVLCKMAIVSNSLLIAVGWVLGGIQINGESVFVLPSQQGIRGPVQGGVHPIPLPRTSFSNRETMDWPGAGLMILIDGQPKRGVYRRRCNLHSPRQSDRLFDESSGPMSVSYG